MSGIIFALGAGLLSTSKDLVSKKLAFSLPDILSAFASFLYALPYYLVLLLVLWILGLEHFVWNISFLMYVTLRAVTDAMAEWLKMKAFALGDISFVSPFLAMTPAFVLITSPLITGDRISLAGTLCILVIALGGFVTSCKRGFSFHSEQLPALFTALGSAFFFSLNVCFDRLAVQEATPAFSGFAMTLAAAIMLAPFAMKRGNLRHEFGSHSKPLHMRGLIETLFMTTKLCALQFLPAQYVAGLVRISLAVTVVAGKFLFQEEQMLRRLAGSTLIICGVLGIILLQ